MAKETRPKGYPKLKNYQPTRFMLPTSHYDKAKADRVVTLLFGPFYFISLGFCVKKHSKYF